MIKYLIKRLINMLISLFLLSALCFIVIDLPPGDFAESYVSQMSRTSGVFDEDLLATMKARYGLDQPIHIRYYKWIYNILINGDFGISMTNTMPVKKILSEVMPFTVIFSFLSLIITYIIAIPIGIISALKQYSITDYIFTIVGFLGLSIPEFMLALTVMYYLFVEFGISPGGLFSPEFESLPWSIAKFIDLLQHLITPLIISGLFGTAVVIRVLRSTLLDELSKDYVNTAVMKGLNYFHLIIKYPVRLAINPIISTVGFILPTVVSGSIIVSIVLNLPTVGPLLILSLMQQDFYLGGAILLILSTLTIFGTFLSDILLMIIDPRIRYE